ncbi:MULTISPECIES: ABC transporter ATP-binding protein [unclassified Leptolyngbya]|uniref:ABC transporter ATP-binding protein n=1 Tax=unclassified Leptolyngbya TaxID=2650499 RepID=UPI0016883177|nr:MULTISPECIES: ABC transporter ATP-binding protein [unclassified Leptolyngbya]MBD1910017.1 ABC transporter ATP-binding protein [Leptolyngbya sp. FACHB-8]MBD2156839.1 ABC transporter ATP-binding protein [Leptolyngbya sp. FACHB-16]
MTTEPRSFFSHTAAISPLPTQSYASEASPALMVRGLGKQYVTPKRRLTVFDGIDLDVQPGELVCLLGPSGCGKSSLLLTIAGLQSADRGDVWVEGQAIRSPHPSIGLMFQEAALLPWLTVQQNIAVGLQLRHMPRLSRPALRSRIDQALLSVGLQDFRYSYPHQLSGGMAQRVAIARTIARQPRLLLMDEPFSALDAITRLEMQQLLLNIIAQQHCAVLLVTHDIDEALLLSDRILLMGRNPGHIYQSWRVTAAQPRLRHTQDLMTLRAEILAALSDVMAEPAAMTV